MSSMVTWLAKNWLAVITVFGVLISLCGFCRVHRQGRVLVRSLGLDMSAGNRRLPHYTPMSTVAQLRLLFWNIGAKSVIVNRPRFEVHDAPCCRIKVHNLVGFLIEDVELRHGYLSLDGDDRRAPTLILGLAFLNREGLTPVELAALVRASDVSIRVTYDGAERAKQFWRSKDIPLGDSIAREILKVSELR